MKRIRVQCSIKELKNHSEYEPYYNKITNKYGFIRRIEFGYSKDEEAYAIYEYDEEKFIYENIRAFSNGFAAVKKEGVWFYLNENLKPATPFTYDFAYDYDNGIATVVKNGEVQYINKFGQYFSGYDKYIIYIHGKYGIVDKHNNRISDLVDNKKGLIKKKEL